MSLSLLSLPAPQLQEILKKRPDYRAVLLSTLRSPEGIKTREGLPPEKKKMLGL